MTKVEREETMNNSQGPSMPGLSDDDDDDQPDGRITLYGGDHTAYWQLPTHIKRCPISYCGRKFEHSELLATHFNKHHAKKTTYCGICNGPVICAVYPDDLERHYRRIHPDVPFKCDQTKIKEEPLENEMESETDNGATTNYKFNHDEIIRFDETKFNCINDQIPQQIDEVPISNNKHLDDKQDDLITLSACGITTYYPFPPHITHCPKPTCSEKFDTRSLAKNHYIAEHASEAIFCSLCKRSITVQKPKSFVEHFRRMHPLDKVPYGFDDVNNTSTMEMQQNVSVAEDDLIVLNACGIRTKWRIPADMQKCPTSSCQQIFKMRSDLIRHFKENHAEGSILCNLCQKPIRITQFDQYVGHYRRIHPFAKVPFTGGDEQDPLNSEQLDTSTAMDKKDDDIDDVIILKGLGQSMKWRMPPNTTRCPVNKCREAFENRSDLTIHYQEQHAPYMVLCEICQKPLTAPNIGIVLKHYCERHPNSGKPHNLIRSVRKSISGRPTENVSGGDDSECDEENDLIILEGLGQRVEYHFPKGTTICPIYHCRKEFGIRAMAIDHFKSRHIKTAVFCPECDRPINAKVPYAMLSHYRNLHPAVEPPEFLKNPVLKEDKNVNVDDDIDDSDMIRLEGAGIITHWRFPPDQTSCPVRHCEIEFVSRSHAIIHYKRQHAKKAILCEQCQKPVAACSAYTLVVHYQRTHPFKKLPYGLGDEDAQSLENQDETDEEEVDDLIELKGLGLIGQWQFPKNINRCPSKACNAAFKSRSTLLDHYRKIHAPNNVLCPICKKPFHAMYPTNVFQHFQNNHKNMDIPAELKLLISNENENNEEDDLIQLNGCGQVTSFRFPKNTTRCPAYNCLLESGFRSKAIAHYKRKHAKDSIFCEQCQKPVGAKCLNTFRKHYDTIHPNVELPEFLKKQEDEGDSENDGVDNLITLTSECGITTYWKFPKKAINYCPSPGCNGRFENRSQVILHYRKSHTNAILCPGQDCNKPISTKILYNFIRHFKEIHPDEELPANIKEKIVLNKKVSDSDETDDNDDDEQSDWITLTGANRISQWQFPDVLNCPVKGCDGSFATRLQTIRHYKKIHSMNFQYCSLCARPVCAYNLYAFRKHFEKKHPNMGLPSEYFTDDEDDLIQLKGGNQTQEWQFPKSIRKRCPASNCDMEFGVRSDIRDHFKKRHTSDHFYCTKCDKLIFAHNQNDFDKHQRQVHCNIKQESGPKRSFHNTHAPSTSTVNQTSSEDESGNGDDVIELKGLGTLIHWRLPKEITKCPVHICDKNFKTRLDLVNHYKEYHANHAVYCKLCKKPIIAHRLSTFKKHHLSIHPNEKFPLDIDDQKSTQLPKAKLLRSSGVIEKIDELDDIITLEDCNTKEPVQWNFPNITQCPVELCRREFGSRFDAFNHFKRRHLKNAQYCSECAEPIEVYRQEDVQEHERRAHLSGNDASDFDQLSNVSRPSTSTAENINPTPHHHSNDDDDSEDDLIMLSGLDCITKYRFPLIKYCPLPSCRIIFGVRSDAINHFRKKHGRETICCIVCKKPVLVSEFEQHYQKMHPNDDISMNFNRKSESTSDESFKTAKANAIVKKNSIEEDDNDEDLIVLEGCNQITKWRFPADTKKCPALRCEFSFSTHSACRNHFKKVHAKHSICCPICLKPYVALNPRNFLTHFQNAHPNSRMPFKFDQASSSTASKDSKDDAVDNTDSDSSEDDTDEDVIILNGCGIRTKWRLPSGLLKCPFLTCQQNFKIRTALVSHYKENHANGSILCKICEKPIRTTQSSKYITHFKRIHPNHKVPYFSNNINSRRKIIHLKPIANAIKNESKEDADQNDDLIKLTGLNKISTWRFPPGLTKCPLKGCVAKFKSRTLAIQHYKANHARTSVLCFICKKPISVKGTPTNYKTHFKNVHPHVKFSLSKNPKIEPSSQSTSKVVEPPKHFVKVRSSVMQSKEKKKKCSICGMKFRNLSRHIMELHTKKRILCPLKSCDFTSKRLELIRRHWKSAHRNFRFPEIAQHSGFTYKTTTATENQECVSASESTSDYQTESKKQTSPRCKTESNTKQSLLMPIDLDESSNSTESSIDEDSSAAEMLQKNRKLVIPNKRIRQISESSSSSSCDYEMQKPGPKRFKLMKKHAKDSERGYSMGTIGSANGSPQSLSTMSSIELPECSVTLEKLNVHDLNKSNASNASNKKHESPDRSPIKPPVASTSSVSQQIKTSHSENMVVNMDVDAMVPIAPANEAVEILNHNSMEYSYMDDIELDPQYDQNQSHFETDLTSSLPRNFDTNAYDAYVYDLIQDPLTSFIDIQPSFQVKTEEMHALPHKAPSMLSDESVIYEVLDSDEEEALNARDSGRETNDTIIETDSSHIPTMGVLMMAKK